MGIEKPNDEDVARILEEAEKIRGTSAEASPAASHAGGASHEGADPAPPPHPDFFMLANLCILLLDKACTGMFGPVGVLQPPLRDQALVAWAVVLQRYAPMVGELGPGGALIAIYGTHLIGCAMTQWTSAPSPSSAGGADLAKPPS